MRGVNVGGHKTFRPSTLAGQLAGLGVVSVGAAGTFVVRAGASAATVRAEFLKRLPFEAHLMICQASDLLSLVGADPFAGDLARKTDGRFISVLDRRPRLLPELPLQLPDGRNWQVSIIAVHGRFVATLHRKVGSTLLYPNEAVEKRLGVVATTRSWNTILRAHETLQAGR